MSIFVVVMVLVLLCQVGWGLVLLDRLCRLLESWTVVRRPSR